MDQLLAFHQKWLGNTKVSQESLAQALFLESDYWEKMAIAINNGISKAFSD